MNTMLDVFFLFLGSFMGLLQICCSCFFDCLHGLHVLQVHGLHDGFIKKTPS